MIKAALFMLMALCVLPAVQGRRKCTNPKGNAGEFYTEGCLKMTCKEGVWRSSLDASLCCYNRQPYLPNTIITATEDGCATASIYCKEEDNVASAVLQVGNNCGQPSTKEQAQEIKHLLVEYMGQSDCDSPVSTSSTSTNTTHATEGKMLNPVVLLTGGFTDHSEFYSVEVYSPFGSCNKDLEDLPFRFSDHSVNYFNGEIIICGGQQSRSRCLYLDNNQRFVEHSKLNEPHYDHVGVVVKDTLAIVGGVVSNTVETWNGSLWKTESFDEIEELQDGSCIDAISKDTLLMVGGGSDYGRKLTNKMMKYYQKDKNQDGVWERMEDFPGPARTGLGCAFIKTPVGDSFIIAGGTTLENNYQDTSFLYNIQKNKWEEVGRLSHVRLGGVIVVVDGRVLMVVGSCAPTTVEEYDVRSKTWSPIAQEIKQRRGQFDAVVVPGALVGC